MQFQFDNNRPIYLQIAEQMKSEIISGRLPGGSRLPSVRELAASAQVNPNTIQKALSSLEQEGLIHTRRTSGKFVSENTALLQTSYAEQARKITQRYLQDMRDLGLSWQDMQELLQLCSHDYDAS